MKIKIGLVLLFLCCSYVQGQGTQAELSNIGKHVGAGVVIGGVGGYVAHKIFDGKRGWTWAGAVGSSLAAGLAKETYDVSNGGVWENDDVIFTAVGGIISGLIMDMLLNTRRTSGKKCGCPPLAIHMNRVNTVDFKTDFKTDSGDISTAIQANYLINSGL